jgi:hypothetical protein
MITARETIETIHDITAKSLAGTPTVTNTKHEPETREE